MAREQVHAHNLLASPLRLELVLMLARVIVVQDLFYGAPILVGTVTLPIELTLYSIQV